MRSRRVAITPIAMTTTIAAGLSATLKATAVGVAAAAVEGGDKRQTRTSLHRAGTLPIAAILTTVKDAATGTAATWNRAARRRGAMRGMKGMGGAGIRRRRRGGDVGMRGAGAQGGRGMIRGAVRKGGGVGVLLPRVIQARARVILGVAIARARGRGRDRSRAPVRDALAQGRGRRAQAAASAPARRHGRRAVTARGVAIRMRVMMRTGIESTGTTVGSARLGQSDVGRRKIGVPVRSRESGRGKDRRMRSLRIRRRNRKRWVRKPRKHRAHQEVSNLYLVGKHAEPFEREAAAGEDKEDKERE